MIAGLDVTAAVATMFWSGRVCVCFCFCFFFFLFLPFAGVIEGPCCAGWWDAGPVGGVRGDRLAEV